MVIQVIKDVVRRFDAALAGYGECRGQFRITDVDGNPLGGVEVSYRVGHSEWIPCGRSRKRFKSSRNYCQLSTVYYRIGEPVAWRFSKPGYTDKQLIRYTAGTEFDVELNSVAMTRCAIADA
ncbi:hypothetical protein PDESU_00647 [Pontiella desulfatans]|uniref:Uncharacterized protein n=1 Tax=Pontiella desulfatans TaxID=2750659 RepID=A0A6C2TX15_PONDE|nr:hypothetical protein [Pontiella desulfatans]VGO12097.1 hypothetical protein PDESU_00647 [Pontiella desulfatans]